MESILPVLAPALFFLATVIAASGPSQRPHRTLSIANILCLLAFIVAGVNLAFVVLAGSKTVLYGGTSLFAFGLRLDLLSSTMLSLVCFIGWIVMRYSSTYLDGEARQGWFAAWMAATLAAIALLVCSGTLLVMVLSFVTASLCLHQLLIFYNDRPAAQRAARKKFIVSRIADVTLAAAAALLAFGYGTADIGLILEMARAGIMPPGSSLAIALLAVTALLKSAQFPFHGWLTEVMEAPTPVSALLHAGLINAGGFLLIRFADLLILSPLTMAGLVMIGAFTAVFGGLVMLTQSAVKTSLAWSTIAQMGFMIMQCGLGLFPIALLHFVAHSLYKAHAFLSSGSAVENVSTARRPGPVAVPSMRAVAKSFLLAMIIYTAVGFIFGFWHKPPQALALGAILIFGVAYLIAQGLADTAPTALTWRTSLYAVAAAVGYFGLQWAAYRALVGSMPLPPPPGPLEWALIVLAVTTFGVVAIAQALFPLWAYHPAAAGLRVHLQNGLYVNALFDHWLGHYALNTAAARKDI